MGYVEKEQKAIAMVRFSSKEERKVAIDILFRNGYVAYIRDSNLSFNCFVINVSDSKIGSMSKHEFYETEFSNSWNNIYTVYNISKEKEEFDSFLLQTKKIVDI